MISFSMKFLNKIFLSDKIILSAIVLNAMVITWMAFPEYRHSTLLHHLDHFFIWFFLLEMLVKWRSLGIKKYFEDSWNKFDFFLVAVSVPSILLNIAPDIFSFIPQTSLLLVFRMFRLLRMFRFIRFIPNMKHILKGVGRAMKASVFVFLGLMFLNFMFALFTCHLFGHLAPEQFGNPLKSSYSIFQMFTIEGWYEMPGALDESMKTPWSLWAMRLYFVIVVMIGGVLGMSLVNAIFVDEMTMDNNDELEGKVDALQEQIAELKMLLIQKEESNKPSQ